MDLKCSSIVRGLSHCTTAESQPWNPYARTPSRRAIACVTCAKAKTKCNKAVPACSRCITKGIMCEPRSTRRTSENKSRTNIRNQSTLPRKDYSISDFSSSHDQSSSPRTSPSSDGTAHTRSMSYDCYRNDTVDDRYNTVKMDEQALVLSGYPVLTPLPTQTLPYIANENQLLSSSEDCDQNLAFFEHTISNSNLSNFGGLWPTTPELTVSHVPVPVLHCIHYGAYHSQPWCEQVSPSIEYDFGPGITDIMVAPETWMMMLDSSTSRWTGQWEWWR